MQLRTFDFYKNKIPGGIKEFFPRAYYLLGWNNEQFAVYYGAEYDAGYITYCDKSSSSNTLNLAPRTVLIWNAEYNTYGNGSNINLTYKYDQDGTWKKYYNINDHLGNVRTVLREENNQPATIVKQFDYAPFGAVLNTTDINRTKFIGKEKDKESNYADHGVRKYDDEIGRFTSIDPLWELDYSWTPYHYSYNNPISFKDPDGRIAIADDIAVGVITMVTLATIAAVEDQNVQKAIKDVSNFIVDKINEFSSTFQQNDFSYKDDNSSGNVFKADATAVDKPIINIGNAGTPPPPKLDNEDKQSKSSQKDRSKGLKEKIEEHKQKLEDYIKDPLKHDNKDHLKNALKKGDKELFKKIYNTRIESINKQIKNFENMLNNQGH